MMQFAGEFPDVEIVSMLSTQLSWSHFIELLPLKTSEARFYYAKDAVERHLGVHLDTFKDPYLFDYMGLNDEYLEADLEAAVLREIELLEMGKSGIMVAQYWTALPPKAEFEQKIHTILAETRKRLKRRKLLLGEINDGKTG